MELQQIGFTYDNEMLFYDSVLNITLSLKIWGTVAFVIENPDVTVEMVAKHYFDAAKEFIQSNFKSVDELGINSLNTWEYREYMETKMSAINVALNLHSILVRMTVQSAGLVDSVKKNLPISQELLDTINSPRPEVPVYDVLVAKEDYKNAEKKLASNNETEEKIPWWKKIFK